MSFEDFCDDVLNLSIGLASQQELREARQAYQKHISKKNAGISQKAQDGRNIARLFGGRPLTGTARQKEWAEKIRAGKIADMSEDHAVLACNPDGLGRGSKFWIENRDKNADEIGCFFEQQKDLLEQAKTAREAGSAERYEEVAAQYNVLTASWGF